MASVEASLQTRESRGKTADEVEMAGLTLSNEGSRSGGDIIKDHDGEALLRRECEQVRPMAQGASLVAVYPSVH
ncbi:hypothetical protein CTA1_4290 [Colletotrichum tanaceti]|uniref:Uncharacterized protein n=1 Tax=Colletotrichum tanaceti TaxID=1306861 RepID=A0A4U6X2R9_9PEZI|nr:hypothetical protein CTA1_4290 [Colletotrichum tanaceti]